jgi:hypothetical protein
MLDKRTFPLVVLRDIDNFKILIDSPFGEGSARDILAHVVDNRTQGRFWFRINSFEIQVNRPVYHYTRYPGSTISVKELGSNGDVGSLKSFCGSWVSICNDYEGIEPFEDVNLKREAEQFASDFKIVDEDAQTSQFSSPQKLYINTALNRISDAINKQPEESIDAEEKADLLSGIEQLKKEVEVQTKSGFIRKLGYFVARVKKNSLKIGTWILTEFIKELIKEGVKKGIQMDSQTIAFYLEAVGLG